MSYLNITDVKQFFYKMHDYEHALRLHDYSITNNNAFVIRYKDMVSFIDYSMIVMYFSSTIEKELLDQFLKVLMINTCVLLRLNYADKAFSFCIEYTEVGVSDAFKNNLQAAIDSASQSHIRMLLQSLKCASAISEMDDIVAIREKLPSFFRLVNSCIIPFVTEYMKKTNGFVPPPYEYIAFVIAEFMDNR